MDLGFFKPRLTNRVTSGTPIAPAFPAPVEVPFAALDWTVSPRFELGYRLPDGDGELRLAYRLLASSGVDIVPAPPNAMRTTRAMQNETTKPKEGMSAKDPSAANTPSAARARPGRPAASAVLQTRRKESGLGAAGGSRT